MQSIHIATRAKDQIIDLTDQIAAAIATSGITDGICQVFAAHTTCAITTADLDPGTDHDYLLALRHLVPQLAYLHPHDPAHTPDHILAMLIGPEVHLPLRAGRLALGTWQRVILVELDGPRQRTVHLTCVGTNSAA